MRIPRLEQRARCHRSIYLRCRERSARRRRRGRLGSSISEWLGVLLGACRDCRHLLRQRRRGRGPQWQLYKSISVSAVIGIDRDWAGERLTTTRGNQNCRRPQGCHRI